MFFPFSAIFLPFCAISESLLNIFVNELDVVVSAGDIDDRVLMIGSMVQRKKRRLTKSGDT